MSFVSLNIEYFPDPTRGVPVYKGYVYVGEPDTDPEIPGNQVQVTLRLSDGSTIAAIQPIRTGAGGVALHNGSPVQVLVEGNYSLSVLNKHQALVYYVANAQGVPAGTAPVVGQGLLLAGLKSLSILSDGLMAITSGRISSEDQGGGSWSFSASDLSSEVTNDPLSGLYAAPNFDPSGTSGAWVRQFEGALSVKWFGAIGDGVTDDTSAIQAAFTLTTDDVSFPFGTYVSNTVSLSNKSGVTVLGNGSTFLMDAVLFPTTYDRCINLISCSKCRVIDFIFDAENSKVSGMSRTGVGLDSCIYCSVEANHFYDVHQCVQLYNASSHCSIKQNSAEQQLPYSLANTAAFLLTQDICIIEAGCSYNVIQENYGNKVRMCLVQGDYNSTLNNISHDSYDSDIYYAGAKGGVIDGNISVRAGKDNMKANTGCSDLVFSNNYCYGAGYHVTNSPDGFLSRESKNLIITGNVIHLAPWDGGLRPASTQIGINITSDTDVIVSDNLVVQDDPGGNEYGIRVGAQYSDCHRVTVKGNRVIGVSDYGIQIGGIFGFKTYDTMVLDNFSNAAKCPFYNYTSDKTTFQGNIVDGGTVAGMFFDTPVEDIVVKDNHFQNGAAGRGLYLNSTGGITGDLGVTVENNTSEATGLLVGGAGDTWKQISQKNNYNGNKLNDVTRSIEGVVFISPYTVISRESGMFFNNTGTSIPVTINLPLATPGLEYSFSRTAAFDIVLSGYSSNTIENTIGSGVYALSQVLTTVNTVVKIVCIVAGRWEISSGKY